MPGSAVVLTKEEMDRSWEQKVSKTRAHHAKMNSRIHKMQSEYQRNLDAFDLEHRRRMEAAEKRRLALQRGKNVTKCSCDQKKPKKKKQRKKSADATGFNRKSLNRQLSHSASDLSKTKPVVEVATSPQGCVCCPRDGDNEDVLHVSSANITLTPRQSIKVEKSDSTKEQPKAPDEADDENIFVRFLEWVGIMKEKDKQKVAKDDANQSGSTVADVPKTATESKDLMKRFGSMVASVGSSLSSKTETPAPEVAPTTATSKDAPVLAHTIGVTPSRNVLEPGKTVLYLNITPSRKAPPSSVADANATTPKTQGIDMQMSRGYVKDTAAKFLAISEAQNATSPGSAKVSPAVVVLPRKEPGQQKIAVSLVQADKMADGGSKVITSGDSKTEIQIVINRL